MDDEENNRIGQRLVTIPAMHIIKKLRTKIDRQNFCRENSKYFLLKFNSLIK